jgi:hypothetical protein
VLQVESLGSLSDALKLQGTTRGGDGPSVAGELRRRILLIWPQHGVTVSDAPANPDALALTGDKESPPFDVDNTPPGVALILAERSPVRVRATVIDDSSLVRKAEYSVDGGRWEEVHPVDGINDAREESYDFAPRLTTVGPHIVVVRASDLLGNVAAARIEIP